MECKRGLAMSILSVCLAVCQTCTLWQNNKKSVQIFIPYDRSFSIVFWKKNGWWEATPSTWNFGSTGPCWSEIADFEPIIARSASAVRPNEKSSIDNNRKSTTRFSVSLRWSSYVAPKSPQGLKTQNGNFPFTIALRLKKVCYKVSLCETVSDKVVRHSLA